MLYSGLQLSKSFWGKWFYWNGIIKLFCKINSDFHPNFYLVLTMTFKVKIKKYIFHHTQGNFWVRTWMHYKTSNSSYDWPEVPMVHFLVSLWCRNDLCLGWFRLYCSNLLALTVYFRSSNVLFWFTNYECSFSLLL